MVHFLRSVRGWVFLKRSVFCGVRAVMLASAAGASISAPEARAQTAPLTATFDAAAVLECRAYAIVHQNRADERSVISAGETRALLEQANLALILGVWGAPLANVETATTDMAAGERMLLESAQRITRLDRDWERDGPYDDRIASCFALVWDATKQVINPLIANRRSR